MRAHCEFSFQLSTFILLWSSLFVRICFLQWLRQWIRWAHCACALQLQLTLNNITNLVCFALRHFCCQLPQLFRWQPDLELPVFSFIFISGHLVSVSLCVNAFILSALTLLLKCQRYRRKSACLKCSPVLLFTARSLVCNHQKKCRFDGCSPHSH